MLIVLRRIRAGKHIQHDKPCGESLPAFKMFTAANLAIGHLANARCDTVSVYFCHT